MLFFFSPDPRKPEQTGTEQPGGGRDRSRGYIDVIELMSIRSLYPIGGNDIVEFRTEYKSLGPVGAVHVERAGCRMGY